MLFLLLKRQIERGKTEGLREKIEVFYQTNRLTQKEYNELISLLGD